ncbi:MAG: hypothetical protein QXI89_01375 [Candidatus Anstonellales archaeon]
MLIEDIMQRISNAEVRWINLNFPDLRGTLKRKVFRAQKMTTNHFAKGIEAEEVNIAFNEIYEEQLSLLPLPSTYAKLPWADAVDRVICTIKKGKERYLKDPIYTLERALNLDPIGEKIAIKQNVSFLITDGTSISKEEGRRSVDIPSKEADWNPLALRAKDSNALASDPHDVYSAVRQQISDVMSDYFNYVVLSHCHGSYASSQILSFDELKAIDAAHCLATLRMAAKAVAIANISLASFMPLPFNEAPADYELSFSAFEKGDNIFYDENDAHKISQIGRYFIGGILEHIDAITFFTNATINSYKRLNAYKKFSSVGIKDKFNAIMIKDAELFNFKLTFPEDALNHYLGLAAIISAGIDGIKKKKEPIIAEESPIIMSEQQRKKAQIKELPLSFKESLEAIQSDNEFLKGVLSTELAYTYTEMRVQEYKEYKQKSSDNDYFYYFHL